MFGAALRATFRLLRGDWPVGLLAYSDDMGAVGAGLRWRLAAVFAIVLLGVGLLVQRSKARGGLGVDWIGLHCDYAAYPMGPLGNEGALGGELGGKVERGVAPVGEMARWAWGA